MKVSINGAEPVEADSVRIYHDGVFAGEYEEGQLEIHATSEGLIMDVWVSREQTLDHNIATSSEMYDDIAARLIEADK